MIVFLMCLEAILLFEGHIEPASLELYLHHIWHRALEQVERDLWEAMDGVVFDPLHSEAKTV